MQGRTGFAVRPAIAALTIGASAIAFVPASEAAPAESCLKAPHGVAPQGSHWYYRIERSSQRRCWYLGDKGRGTAQRTTTRTAPQAEPDQDEESDSPAARVATAPAAPVANAPAAPLANVSPPPSAEQPKPVITTLVTRNVSNADQIAQAPATQDSSQQPAAPNSQPSTTAEAPPAPFIQGTSDQPIPTPVAEQPAPPTAAAPAQPASASAQTMPTLQLLLGALALLGLLTSAALFVIAMVRRRNDVLNRRREAHALPYEASPEMSAEDHPTVQPMRALDPIRRHDDVDEALRRMTRRRRAAATS